jgi:hypothetical protein
MPRKTTPRLATPHSTHRQHLFPGKKHPFFSTTTTSFILFLSIPFSFDERDTRRVVGRFLMS